ncbi:MAG: DUF4136 domain-containing protein [Limisphaerales bacterium]
MKAALFSLVVTIVLALAGCSSAPDQVDSGGIRAKTFSFIHPGPSSLPEAVDPRAPVHAMIQEAIAKNLAARGVSRIESGGDVTVAYLIITGNNVSTTSISRYFGYGRDATELQQKAQKAYTGSKNPDYFEAGTLVVDVVNTGNFELLWRRHVTRPLLRNLPEAEKAEVLQGYVDEVLGELRLSPN